MAARNLVLIIVLIVVFILIFVYSALSRGARGRHVKGNRGIRRPGARGGSPAAGTKDASARTARPALPSTGKRAPCPLCGTILADGERIRSLVYRAGSDSLSHIFGCPRCAPDDSRHTGGLPAGERPQRICPVCRNPIPQDGYLVARMFERSDGSIRKTHVHVLGCTGCRHRKPGQAR